MKTRQKRALKNTLIMALFLSLPMGALLYYRVKNLDKVPMTTGQQVKPFYLTSIDNSGLSLSDLRSKVTLLALIPAGSLSRSELDKALESAQNWATKQMDHKTLDSLQLLAIYQGPMQIADNWLQVPIASTQNFAEEIKPFVDAPVSELTLVFIDQNAAVRGVFPYSRIDDWGKFEALWSKLTFNHYLGDYLSKRTFFGPKREHGTSYYH